MLPKDASEPGSYREFVKTWYAKMREAYDIVSKNSEKKKDADKLRRQQRP